MADNSFRVKTGSLFLQPLSLPPSNPIVGDIYVDSSGVLNVYDGSSWTALGSGGGGAGPGSFQSINADIPFNDALTISRSAGVVHVSVLPSTSAGSVVDVQSSSSSTLSSSWSSSRGLDRMGGLSYNFTSSARIRSITVALATSSGTSNVRCIAISQTGNTLLAMSPTLASVTNTMSTYTFTFPDILCSGNTIFAFSTVSSAQSLLIGGAASGPTSAVIQNADEAQLGFSSFVTQPSIAPYFQYTTTGSNQNTTITGITAPSETELPICCITNNSGVLLALGSATYNPTSANDKISLYDRDKAYILRPLETAYLVYIKSSESGGSWKILNDVNTQIESATVNTCTISENAIVGGLKLANAVSFTGSSLKVQGNLHISSTASFHGSGCVDIDGDVFQDGTLSFNGFEFYCRSMLSSEKSCFQFIHTTNYETPALWIRNDWLFTDVASAKNSVMLAATTLIPYIRISGRLGFNEGTGVNDILIGVSSSSSYTDTTTAHLRSFRVGGLYDADIYCPSRTGISYFGWEFDCEGECSESTIFIENDTNLATHTLPIRIGGSVLNSTITGIGKANSSTINAVPRGSAVTIQGNARGSTITTTGGYKSNLGAACGPVIIIGDTYNTSIAANHTATVSGGNHGAGGDVSIGGNATADSSATINTSGGPTLTSGLGGAAGNLRIGGAVSNVAITCNGGSSGTSNAGNGGFINIGGSVIGNGAIASNGGTSTGARGGNGRNITISGNCEQNVTATGGNSAGVNVGGSGGGIVVRGQTSGSINASGGTSVSSTGGTGGGITIGYSDGGSLTTSGGNSSSSSGGISGSVIVGSDNRANITTTGGNGGNGNGGNGGSVEIRGSHSGNGTITTRGGTASGTGNGGAGGSVTIEGNLSTEIDSRGMAGSGSTGVGGNGGAITINGTSYSTNQHLADGGNGTGTGAHVGGTGGTILIRGTCFSSISTRGGNAAGTSAAGAGGACRISGMMGGSTIDTSGGSNSSSGVGGAAGQIIIDGNCSASLSATGGNNSSTGNAGNGAAITVRGSMTGGATTISSAGGSNTGSAGNGGIGGSVTISGNCVAAITCSGGASKGSTGVGGTGGAVTILGNLANNITTNGGVSTGTGAHAGGAAGTIVIYGDAHSSVSISGSGGNAAGSSNAGNGSSLTCNGSFAASAVTVSGGICTGAGNGGNGGAITIRGPSRCISFTGSGGTSTSGSGGNGSSIDLSEVILSSNLDLSLCSGGNGSVNGGTASVKISSILNSDTGLNTFTPPSGGNGTTGTGGDVTVSVGTISGSGQLGNATAGSGISGGRYWLFIGTCSLRPGINSTITAGNGSAGNGGELRININTLNYGNHPGNSGFLAFTSGSATGATGAGGALRVYIGNMTMGGGVSTSQNSLTFTAGNGSTTGRAGVIQITGHIWNTGSTITVNGGTSGIVGTPGTDEYFTVTELVSPNLSITGASNATTNWLPMAVVCKNVTLDGLTYRVGTGAGANPTANANHGKFLWTANAVFGGVTLTNAGDVVTIGAYNSVSACTLRCRVMNTKTGALWDPVAAADEAETINSSFFYVYHPAGTAGSRWIAK